MKNQTCCFTGHRNIPANEYEQIQSCLEVEIVDLIDQGIEYFYAGGARGFDTIAEQTVLTLKKSFPRIKLVLILPCEEQTKGWKGRDVELYEQIRLQADMVVHTAKNYEKGCMHKRNRHLVDGSSVCICYLRKNVGGTAYTVHYARQKGLQIVNIASPFSNGDA